MDDQRAIMDSIKCFVETDDGQSVIGSTDDCLKIVYNKSNEIEKFFGFKSWVSVIKAYTVNDINFSNKKCVQLWIGDMFGYLHYLIKEVENKIDP